MKLTTVRLTPLFARWLPLAVLATLAALLIYVVGQQQLRLGANDVPLQLVEDTTAVLSQGLLPSSVSTAQSVDIAHSLAPFIVIFSNDGKATDGSGRLNNQLPELPSGVFSYARRHQDDRITWQPQAGVRVAAVIKHYEGSGGGFVLAGRNLREVEERESLLTAQVLGGWLTMLAATFATLVVLEKREVS